MFRVKREKGGKVTWATGVHANGNILGLSPDVSAAKPITEVRMERLKAFYKGNTNAGSFTFEPVEVTAEVLIEAQDRDAAADAAAFEKLRAEVKSCRATVAELKAKCAALENSVAAKATELADVKNAAAAEIKDLELQAKAAKEEAAAATAKLTELANAQSNPPAAGDKGEQGRKTGK